MEVADQVVVMNQRPRRAGRRARASSTTRPANEFVMTFVGQANRVGDALVRPHDLELSPGAETARARGACRADRAPRLRGPRSSSSRDDGEPLAVQMTRDQARASSSWSPARSSSCGAAGDRTFAEEPVPSCRPAEPRRPPRAAARDVGQRTRSSTPRRLARTAIHTSRSGSALPSYSSSSERTPRTFASGPVDGADHLGERDLLRRPREPVAAVGPALAARRCPPFRRSARMFSRNLGGIACAGAIRSPLTGPPPPRPARPWPGSRSPPSRRPARGHSGVSAAVSPSLRSRKRRSGPVVR